MTEDKEWTLEFIEDYRKHQALWDPKHRFYSNIVKRNDAWIAISKKNNMDIKSVKNKIKSLRSYFSKELRKVLTMDNYESTWFAYKALNFVGETSTIYPEKEATEDEGNALEDFYHLDCSNLQDESPNRAYTSEADNDFHQTHDGTSVKDERNREDSRHKRGYEKKDECGIFAQLISHKLRKLNPRNRLLAQHRINNVLYDLELGELDSTSPMVSSGCTVPTKQSPSS